VAGATPPRETGSMSLEPEMFKKEKEVSSHLNFERHMSVQTKFDSFLKPALLRSTSESSIDDKYIALL
jgi:hypothetical protein